MRFRQIILNFALFDRKIWEFRQKKTSHKTGLEATCRIRTNDPEITNHVLWPAELKRRVAQATASHTVAKNGLQR